MNKHFWSQGFTLLELLVVIALLGVLAGVGADLFVHSLKAYYKSQVLNRLDQNGNYAMSTIINHARNAKEVTQDSAQQITVTDQSEATIVFTITTQVVGESTVGVITKKVGAGEAQTITAANPETGVDVDIVNSGFSLNLGNPPSLEINLKLWQPPASPIRTGERVSIDLSNTVTIRGGYE